MENREWRVERGEGWVSSDPVSGVKRMVRGGRGEGAREELGIRS